MSEEKNEVSYEEQIERGIVPRPKKYVTPEPARSLPSVRPMSEAESNALQAITQPSQRDIPITLPPAPTATHSGHMRENFDVRAMGQVAERFSVQRMSIFGGITAASTLSAWYVVGGALAPYTLGWLVVWGIASYVAHHQAIGQAYRHSPTGVARLEQESQITMHDRSATVEEHRIDADKEARLADIQARRDLGMAFLKRLEGKRDE